MSHTTTRTLADTPGDMQAVIATAIASTVPDELDPNQLYGVTLPNGAYTVLDLSEHRDRPVRKEGKVDLSTVEAFTKYLSEHKSDETTVWVHPTSGAMVAVLDDHSTGEAGWGGHRAALTLIRTDEWLRWMGLDGQLVDQVTFAEHIEDSQIDIVRPDAADLLEIAQSFHGTTNTSWRSSQRLADGSVQFTHHEEVETSAGRDEPLEVPSTFELAIAPFVGEDPVRLVARLRYRMRDGKLSIGYKLDRPADAIRDVIDRITLKLASEFEHVYSGSPRS
jgi:uncharacterized protein YfdQ (DUF2303 family)